MAGKTVADYSDAVKRIVETDVPDDAMTEAEVRAALAAHGGVQVHAEDQNGQSVADNIVEQVITVEKVRDVIEQTGEIPTENEISRFADAADDYDLTDRVERVADAVNDEVATVEEIEQAVRERQEQAASSGRPTFREDVEGAVDSVAEDQEIVGASADDVVDQEARDIGAPSRTNYQRATYQTIAQADSVTPSEVVDGTEAKTPVQIIRGESGEPIAATGGPGGDVSRQVADEMGVEYMDDDEVTSEMRTAGTGDRVDLTLRGRKIGEVDV